MSSKHTSSEWKFQLIMKEMILINSFDLEILFGVTKRSPDPGHTDPANIGQLMPRSTLYFHGTCTSLPMKVSQIE